MTINVQKVTVMDAWNALLDDPAFVSATPEERYETRLSLADDLKQQSLIDEGDWRELNEEAVAAYADELG